MNWTSIPNHRIIKVTLAILFLFKASLGWGQSLELYNVTQSASSQTAFRDADLNLQTDTWSGSSNLGVTGTTSGGSSLPNPGNEASGSGSFFADHEFGLTSWNLSGWAQGSIDAGLGAPFANMHPSIGNTTGVGASLDFFIDQPFILTLSGLLQSEFTGSGIGDLGPSNGASIRLFAVILEGVLVNQYVVDWRTFAGSSGGIYSNSWSSGVFRLEIGAGTQLSSNVADAFGTQYSSYDAQLTVTPIPEPSGALLLGVAALAPLLRRRRRQVSTPALR